MVEPKLDGVRTLVTVHDGEVRLQSRNGLDVTECYPELLVPPPNGRNQSLVLDGEIVAFTAEHRVSFQALQARMNLARPSQALRVAIPVVFAAFDVLWADGEDLTTWPLSARRDVLVDLDLAGAWQLVPRLDVEPGPDLVGLCADAGLEGVVVKAAGSRYLPGRRSSSWVKVKARSTLRAVVGGLLPERECSSQIGSLAVGAYDDAGLRYLGQVGYGLGRATADRLAVLLESLVVDDCPFVDRIDGPLRWVDPLVVVEVTYREVTWAGTLRQPVLTGVVPEADPAQVPLSASVAERVAGRGARVGLAARQRL